MLIASEAVDDVRRCNVSSWYVEPEYCVYGTPLVRRALRGRAGPALGADLDSREVALLRGHARWDCLSLVCRSRDGRAPFVFGLRRRRGILPFAYLIHCRSLESFAAHARPLGRYLLSRGVGFVVADADAKIAGVPGW